MLVSLCPEKFRDFFKVFLTPTPYGKCVPFVSLLDSGTMFPDPEGGFNRLWASVNDRFLKNQTLQCSLFKWYRQINCLLN